MNVAHIVPSFFPATVYGGPTQSVYRLCQALSRQGCRIRVLTTNANGPSDTLKAAETRDVSGFPVRYCRRLAPESISLELLGRLPEILRWADVVHLMAVYSFPVIPTLALAKVMRKPVLWSPRGALQRWEHTRHVGLKRAWEGGCRWMLPADFLFHFTSEDEKKQSLARFPGKESLVIPNGVEIPEAPGHVPAEGQFRMVYLGRINPIKGLENLLQACRLFDRPETGNWTLTIAGDGTSDYVAALKALAVELGVGRRVRWLGAVSSAQKGELFARADAAVVPSHSESFGIVIAEALAHGVPVIASTGTPWSRLEEKRCGFWVSNHPTYLFEAMEQMRRNDRRPMGERGRAWVRQEFSWERLAAQVMDGYRTLQTSHQLRRIGEPS